MEREFESRHSHTNWDLIRGYTKFDFAVDEGKGRLNPSRDKKLRQAPQKEGGEILFDLPPV